MGKLYVDGAIAMPGREARIVVDGSRVRARIVVLVRGAIDTVCTVGAGSALAPHRRGKSEQPRALQAPQRTLVWDHGCTYILTGFDSNSSQSTER